MVAIWGIAGLLAGVDPALLASVCFVESSHNASAYVAKDGHTPSYGICQVKEATARELGFSQHKSFLMKPEVNALYAGKYLAKQKKRFGTWERAISSYNAGRPIAGNARYVDKVMREWGRRHGKRQEGTKSSPDVQVRDAEQAASLQHL